MDGWLHLLRCCSVLEGSQQFWYVVKDEVGGFKANKVGSTSLGEKGATFEVGGITSWRVLMWLVRSCDLSTVNCGTQFDIFPPSYWLLFTNSRSCLAFLHRSYLSNMLKVDEVTPQNWKVNSHTQRYWSPNPKACPLYDLRWMKTINKCSSDGWSQGEKGDLKYHDQVDWDTSVSVPHTQLTHQPQRNNMIWFM